LGIALADTFGTDAFLHDFDEYLARIFDGVRQDSGDPKEFGEKVIAHYQKMNIDPSTKSLVFSDGLTATVAAQLSRYFGNRIRVSHGIGTHFTNDFAGSQPLNIVIKLSTCNGIPVVKLSDVPTKAIGDRDALRVARWTFLNQPLDQGI
jgi:nicotinate phosphoribosyltransferase